MLNGFYTYRGQDTGGMIEIRNKGQPPVY
jgi:hypothetical protein